ncbi:ribonuclease HII [Candidatus Bipolaricaulota bacterium]|jgi:ribonuclease HII|nr:ribonuclease HII [Candidatus Bipolaricaulota bacterium]
MNHAARIDRTRNLLAFDLSFLGVSPHETSPEAHGQTFLAFANPREPDADQPPSRRLVGFDEAGRGSLAGPVTVACVHFDLSRLLSPTGDLLDAVLETFADLNDSKKVTERNRERLYTHILTEAHCGIGCASAVEIDRFGIVKACSIAAVRAYRRLGCGPGYSLGNGPGCGLGNGIRADVGLFDRGLSLGEGESAESIPSSMQLTRGDAKSFHIAAASILAKVCRDAIMRDLGARVAVYGFASHKGYGTAAHFEAIQQHGPSRFHRQTFLGGTGYFS